jgi:hypothetical protein
MSCRAVISGSEGASRISSVLGLNVRPSTATVFPRSAPQNILGRIRDGGQVSVQDIDGLRWLAEAAVEQRIFVNA